MFMFKEISHFFPGGLQECETQDRTNKKIQVETVALEMAYHEAASLLSTGACHSFTYTDRHSLGAYWTPAAVWQASHLLIEVCKSK